MLEKSPVRVAIVGGGLMAQIHIAQMLKMVPPPRAGGRNTTQIVVVSEPAPVMYDAVCALFTEAGLEPPPNQPDLSRLLKDFDGEREIP